MKKAIKLLLTLTLTIIISLSTVVSVNADGIATQDGIEVSIKTDKENYSSDDEIEVTVDIKNTNSYIMNNMNLTTSMPGSFDIKSGYKNIEGFSINAGESFSNKFTAVKSYENPNTSTSGTSFLWITIMIITAAAFLFLFIKAKDKKKAVSLLLCLVLLISFIPSSSLSAFADGTYNGKDMTASCHIILNNANKTISANVQYPTAKDYCTVSFVLNSPIEESPKPQKIKPGEFAVKPVVTERDGYKFAGWFLDANDSDWLNTFAFDTTPVNSDLTLYAIWVDMSTDTDGDGLPDDMEGYVKSDKNIVDTDKDGLNDYQDAVLLRYSPINPDTDNDGVSDAKEDFDEDSLLNDDELKRKTDPTRKDSDFDNLDDNKEVSKYTTNPLNVDTDDDKVSDGDEVALGTDPLKKESTFEVSVSSGKVTEESPVSVTVTTNCKGGQVGTLKVAPVDYNDNPLLSTTIPGYLDVGYDITIDGEIDNANITFEYDKSLGTESKKFQPRIYYVDEKLNLFKELKNQIVEDGKVSANVTHFSTYILLNKVEFDLVWSTEIKPPQYTQDIKGLDVVFVIDSSGSMSWNDEDNLRLTAAENFVDKLTKNDRAAVVDFDDMSYLYQSFTSDHALLKKSIKKIDDYGGTDLKEGMDLAISQFTDETYSRTDAYKYIIFLTDGDGYYEDEYTEKANNNGIVVYTIGLGSDVEDEVLTDIANGTIGKYYSVSAADALNDVYLDIAVETIDYTKDSNNDRISDYFNDLIKSGKLVLGNGARDFMYTDFNYDADGNPSNDFDGDGVLNGDELVVKYNESTGKVFISLVSDPMMVYSDSDNFNDADEHKMGTNPMTPTYSRSSINYQLDDNNFTYELMLDEENKLHNKLARNIWSTLVLNLSHVDEAVNLIATFLSDYDNTETIIAKKDEIMKDEIIKFGSNMISAVQTTVEIGDTATSIIDDGGTVLESVKKTSVIKKFISDINSKKVIPKNAITNFFAKNKGLDKIWKNADKFTEKATGLKSLNLLGLGFSTLNQAIDVYNTINTYSAIISTASTFEKSLDVLESIARQDNMPEKYVAEAANKIILTLKHKYLGFIANVESELKVAKVENYTLFAIGLLTKSNPYVAAISLLITILDLATPCTEIAQATYYLYVIDEIDNAYQRLFKPENDTNKYFCSFKNDQKKKFEMLCSARLYGCDFTRILVENQWFISKEGHTKTKNAYLDQISSEEKATKNFLNSLLFRLPTTTFSFANRDALSGTNKIQ